MANPTKRLTESLNAVCPVAGVDIGTPGDPASVRIDYGDGATLGQRKAAIDVLAAFDWRPETQAAWEQGRASLQAVSLVAASVDPVYVALRIVLRLLCTRDNDVREKCGLTRTLEPEIVATLVAYAMGGAGAPATIPPAK